MSQHISAATPHFQFQTLVWQRRVAWLFMAVVAYGSVFPPDFDFSSPQRFGWFTYVWPSDIAKNIALFVPLGLLIASMARHVTTGRSIFWARWTAAAFALALGLQIAQLFLPRDPEVMDVITNMLGLAVGYALQPPLWRAVAHAAPPTARRVADPFLSLLAMVWMLAAMFPFLPVLTPRMLQRNLNLLSQMEWQWQPFLLQAGLTWVGVHCLYHALAPLPRLGRAVGLLVGFAVLLALMLKVLGYSHLPGIPLLAGIVVGLCLWLLQRLMVPISAQHAVVGVVALLLYLGYALWPLHWRESASFMRMLPFGSLLGNSMGQVLRAYCLEALALGMLLWLLARQGGLLVATLCTATLGFACEWMQRWLMYRTPESSTVVIVLVLAFFYRACAPADEASSTPWVKV